MDPVSNPYSPGAGNPPPELAGRDKLREQVRVAIARIRRGNAAKSVLMVGLRGVGKTVLLDRMRTDAEQAGAYTVRMEAPENRSLPALLAPQLRLVLLRLSRVEAAKKVSAAWASSLGRFRKSAQSKVQ
jgi:predicted AAA+ superfamily ATPase